MLTVDDVQIGFRDEHVDGRLVVKMFVDDTKLVSKTVFAEDAAIGQSVDEAKIRMRAEYDAVLRRKYFDSTRGHFIGQSLHALPKRLSLWWDDDEFYLVTESPLGAPYCERMSEKQALQWARAYLKLEMPDGFAVKPVQDTVN